MDNIWHVELSSHPKSLVRLSSPSLARQRLLNVMYRAHSFPRQNLTNSAGNLVNSAEHRSKADEIPRLNAVTR